MDKLRLSIIVLLIFNTACLFSQGKWHYDVGLGASLHTGNVNHCNVSHDAAVNRNDSVVAFDFNYKFLYSSLIQKNDAGRKWEETNFEINGGVKLDLFQYDTYSPFLACEVLTNKYKGYDLKLSSLAGFKYRIYHIPSFCDYSISAAFVYDRNDFTDETTLPDNNYRISIRPKIKQQLAENLMLGFYLFYQPSILDFNDYIINTVTKLQTKITRTLFLDLSLTYDYRSRVPSNKYRNHDVLTEVSLRFKM